MHALLFTTKNSPYTHQHTHGPATALDLLRVPRPPLARAATKNEGPASQPPRPALLRHHPRQPLGAGPRAQYRPRVAPQRGRGRCQWPAGGAAQPPRPQLRAAVRLHRRSLRPRRLPLAHVTRAGWVRGALPASTHSCTLLPADGKAASSTWCLRASVSAPQARFTVASIAIARCAALTHSQHTAQPPRALFAAAACAGYRPVIEYCGGTELGGGYLSSTPLHPATPSVFGTPTLGCRLVLLPAEGTPLQQQPQQSSPSGSSPGGTCLPGGWVLSPSRLGCRHCADPAFAQLT